MVFNWWDVTFNKASPLRYSKCNTMTHKNQCICHLIPT